jgi:hypothetical protein
LEQGWYEYKCPLVGGCNTPLVKLLQKGVGELPAGCVPIIREYLVASSGGNLGSISNDIDDLVQAIAIFYARLIAGDGLVNILRELEASKDGTGFETPCRALLTKP